MTTTTTTARTMMMRETCARLLACISLPGKKSLRAGAPLFFEDMPTGANNNSIAYANGWRRRRRRRRRQRLQQHCVDGVDVLAGRLSLHINTRTHALRTGESTQTHTYGRFIGHTLHEPQLTPNKDPDETPGAHCNKCLGILARAIARPMRSSRLFVVVAFNSSRRHSSNATFVNTICSPCQCIMFIYLNATNACASPKGGHLFALLPRRNPGTGAICPIMRNRCVSSPFVVALFWVSLVIEQFPVVVWPHGVVVWYPLQNARETCARTSELHLARLYCRIKIRTKSSNFQRAGAVLCI